MYYSNYIAVLSQCFADYFHIHVLIKGCYQILIFRYLEFLNISNSIWNCDEYKRKGHHLYALDLFTQNAILYITFKYCQIDYMHFLLLFYFRIANWRKDTHQKLHINSKCYLIFSFRWSCMTRVFEHAQWSMSWKDTERRCRKEI